MYSLYVICILSIFYLPTTLCALGTEHVVLVLSMACFFFSCFKQCHWTNDMGKYSKMFNPNLWGFESWIRILSVYVDLESEFWVCILILNPNFECVYWSWIRILSVYVNLESESLRVWILNPNLWEYRSWIRISDCVDPHSCLQLWGSQSKNYLFHVVLPAPYVPRSRVPSIVKIGPRGTGRK